MRATKKVGKKLPLIVLRAVVCKYRESGPRSKPRIFFPFRKLFSKTIFKSSSEAPFLRKIGKFKTGLNLVEGSMEIVQIRAFPKRLKEKTKADL